MKVAPGSLSLALALNTIQAITLQPDIRADTDRDGVVDVEGTSDLDKKALWTLQRGAIFLPNVGDKHSRCSTTDAVGNLLSDDELAFCHDASGHLAHAPEYLAPLRTVPMSVTDQATARIYATPRAACDRVRIFLQDDTFYPNSTSSWRLVDPEFAFSATQIKHGITLGIDSRELVKDAEVWDGSVTVRFEVTDGSDHAIDAVALHLAPFLTHHHLQKVETLVSTAANESGLIQANFIRQLDAARVEAGIEQPLLLFKQPSDIWAQDFIEPGYVSMPGPDGPISMRIMLRSAQSTRREGRQVFEQLRGAGVGGFQPPGGTGSGFGYREINSYGNLETTPPYTSKSDVAYPSGRIIMGKHFERLPAKVLLDFLYGQRIQSPLLLETGWLLIGHVDEFVQFLPYNNTLGFTIAVADTRSAISIYRRLKSDGYGNISAISYEWKESEHGPKKPGIGMSINDLLTNQTFIEANEYAQRHIDANLEILLSEIPLCREDVIHVPTLFRESDFGIGWNSNDGSPPHTERIMENEKLLMSLNPASINGIVIGNKYFSPKPFGPVVDGGDVLAQAVEVVYARAGMHVQYVDDFLSHHIGGGEIHCGSNTLRQTDMIWWEQEKRSPEFYIPNAGFLSQMPF